MPPKRKGAAVSKGSKRRGKDEESASESDNDEVDFKDDDSEEDQQPNKKRATSSRAAPSRPARRSTTTKKKTYKEKSDSEEEEEPEEEEEEEEQPTYSFGLKWTEDDTLYYLTSPSVVSSEKVVAFDMDDTIITPKSKGKFPTGRNDWKWLYPEVPEKLKQLHKDGYNIVIFTNQAGIEKNHTKPADIKGKILDLSVALGFPLQAFVAAATDKNRKPNTTMWKFFENNCVKGVKLDLSKCIFVGDAAGRPKEWKKGAKKDFSCTDRTFAFNVGITFKTPEEFFLNDTTNPPFEWDGIDPKQALEAIEKDLELIVGGSGIPAQSQEIIVMVGRPASGKSSFSKKYLVPHGYERINQDTLKTKEKCIKAAKEAVAAGKSVVIDNTNPGSDIRAEYISIGKSKGIPVRCFVFQTDPDLAYHLNFYREKVEGTRRVPDVGYNTFKSKFVEPTLEEGFTEIKKVNWVPDFASEDHKKLFLERT